MLFFKYKEIKNRDFPDGPVVKTQCSHCRGHGFHPLSGTKILHTLWYSKIIISGKLMDSKLGPNTCQSKPTQLS